jgi:hypothetical protein
MSTTLNVRSTATAACLALLLGVLAVFASVPSASASSALVVRGCNAYSGAKTLGTTYTDAFVKIYACGVRPSFDGAKKGTGPVVLPFAGSTTYYRGYQCIELVARYLKARYGADAGRANGAQAVDRYVAAYPTKFLKVANGTKRMAPRKGDVLSLSTNGRFNDVGHTGIVISSSIGSSGNGSVVAVEQNWGGTGGTRGYHSYRVKSWRVQYAPMPYIKWLRAR